MYAILIVLISFSFAYSKSSSEPTFRISCKAEYRDKKNEVKVKEFPVTLHGHFDDPDAKCLQACDEKECKIVYITIL